MMHALISKYGNSFSGVCLIVQLFKTVIYWTYSKKRHLFGYSIQRNESTVFQLLCLHSSKLYHSKPFQVIAFRPWQWLLRRPLHTACVGHRELFCQEPRTLAEQSAQQHGHCLQFRQTWTHLGQSLCKAPWIKFPMFFFSPLKALQHHCSHHLALLLREKLLTGHR